MPIILQRLDIVEVRLFCQLQAQGSVNVLHYRADGDTGALGNLDDAVDSISSAFGAAYKAILCAQAEYRGITAQKVFPLPLSVAVTSSAGAGFGTVLGDALPKQSCGVIKKLTDLAGPRNRGRMYAAFPSEEDCITQGRPDPTYVIRLLNLASQLLINRLLGPVVGAPQLTLFPVVWSKTGNVRNPLTGVAARTFFGTQRRRGDFGKPNQSPV